MGKIADENVRKDAGRIMLQRQVTWSFLDSGRWEKLLDKAQPV
jgi:hypothetical protein